MGTVRSGCIGRARAPDQCTFCIEHQPCHVAYFAMPLDCVFTDYDYAYFRQVFNLFDPLRTGSISNDDMKEGLPSLGQVWTVREADALIKKADADKSNTIEFDEFVDLMEKTNRSKQQIEDDIKMALKDFDDKKTGFISLDDLIETLTATGFCGEGTALIESDLRQIFAAQKSWQEGDDQISTEDFKNFLISG